MSSIKNKNKGDVNYFLNWGLNFEENFALVDERKQKAREQTLRRNFPQEYQKLQHKKGLNEVRAEEAVREQNRHYRQSRLIVKRLRRRVRSSNNFENVATGSPFGDSQTQYPLNQQLQQRHATSVDGRRRGLGKPLTASPYTPSTPSTPSNGDEMLSKEVQRVQSELQHDGVDAWNRTLSEVREILSKYSKGLEIPTEEDPSIDRLIADFAGIEKHDGNHFVEERLKVKEVGMETNKSVTDSGREDDESASDDENTPLLAPVEPFEVETDTFQVGLRVADDGSTHAVQHEAGTISDSGAIEDAEDTGEVEEADQEPVGTENAPYTIPVQEDWPMLDPDEIDPDELQRLEEEIMREKDQQVLLLGQQGRRDRSDEADPVDEKGGRAGKSDAASRPNTKIMISQGGVSTPVPTASTKVTNQIVPLPPTTSRREDVIVSTSSVASRSDGASSIAQLRIATPQIKRVADRKDDITFVQGGEGPDRNPDIKKQTNSKKPESPAERARRERDEREKERERIRAPFTKQNRADHLEKMAKRIKELELDSDQYLDDYLVELQCGENAVIQKNIKEYVPEDRKWGYILIDDDTQVRSPFFRNFNPRKFDRHYQQASKKIRFRDAPPTHETGGGGGPSGGDANRYYPPSLKGFRQPVPTHFAGIWYAKENLPRLDLIKPRRGDFYIVRSEEGPVQVRLEGKALEVQNGSSLSFDGDNWTAM